KNTQALIDAQKKSEHAKEQAVLMESKRSTLKINMAENRARTAAAKIEVIEAAARETPERLVGEVWEIAKVAKPATAPAPAAPIPQVSAAPQHPIPAPRAPQPPA